jgi:peptidoglycan-N-acetylglucosamine deacetylase
MLKYKKIVFVFASVILILIAADFFFSISFLFYAGIIIAFIVVMSWGSADIRSGFYFKTLNSGDSTKRSLALTFDDGPDKIITPAVLEILAREKISAAFFCIGRKASENSELIKRIDREGHIIGSHSYSHHFFFDFFSRKKMLLELQETEEIIERCIHKKIRLFRPPYGVTNPSLAMAIRRKNYLAIGWSLRSRDTVIYDENKLLRRVTTGIKPGDIVLFHDTNSRIEKILEEFIRYARRNDFTFERLDKHLGIEAYG